VVSILRAAVLESKPVWMRGNLRKVVSTRGKGGRRL
jgi:hypothetical protein